MDKMYHLITTWQSWRGRERTRRPRMRHILFTNSVEQRRMVCWFWPEDQEEETRRGTAKPLEGSPRPSSHRPRWFPGRPGGQMFLWWITLVLSCCLMVTLDWDHRSCHTRAPVASISGNNCPFPYSVQNKGQLHALNHIKSMTYDILNM